MHADRAAVIGRTLIKLYVRVLRLHQVQRGGPSLSSVGALSRCGGHRSRVRALLVPDFPPGTVGSLLNYVASHAWSHKGIATRPSPTEPWMDPVISRRTRFDLSVVVGLFVYVWCECGVRV